MTRRYLIASGKVGPAFDSIEALTRARYLRERRIPFTEYVLTDFGLYPPKDADLAVELEASLQVPR